MIIKYNNDFFNKSHDSVRTPRQERCQRFKTAPGIGIMPRSLQPVILRDTGLQSSPTSYRIT